MIHSPLYRLNFKTIHWDVTRKIVYARARGRCEKCSDLAPLQIHHRHYRTLGQESPP
jgi:5-methylcytosine-specific restriction endonuclease McrA